MNKQLSLRGMIYAAMFAALTAIGANISFPLPLVPLTLQTLFVFLAGLLLGSRYGALSQIIYLILGIIGLPVFSQGNSGLGVLLGPRGGFLFGFIIGAFIIGLVVELKKNADILWMVFAMLIGLVIIYSAGVIQLSYIAPMTIKEAIVIGALKPLSWDIAKLFAAAIVASKVRDKIKH